MHAAINSWARASSGINLSRSAKALAHNSAVRVDAQVPWRCGVGIRRSCPVFVDVMAQRRRGAGEQVAAPQVAAPFRDDALVPLTSCFPYGHRLPATLGELFH